MSTNQPEWEKTLMGEFLLTILSDVEGTDQREHFRFFMRDTLETQRRKWEEQMCDLVIDKIASFYDVRDKFNNCADFHDYILSRTSKFLREETKAPLKQGS